jgi:hypothetical protein
VVLADLNGDGIPDLIVANSGGNNVLVYPGLGNGQFGPELNGGHGFAVGTNPVSITVANLNGRPDLVVANEGSNDVSILLNQATASGGFTFVPGPRLQGGDGPTSTAVTNVPGNRFPDLAVTDSGSNQVRLLPGVGNGFFIDSGSQVKIFPLPAGSDPVQVMAGIFVPNQGPGPQIATVDRGTNTITVISDFTSVTVAPVFDSFSTGGIEPVQAIAVTLPGQALESLIVANTGDGLFTLLGGADGLEVEETRSDSELPEPTALDLPSISGNELSFYAATAGMEAAFTLAFILPGFTPATAPVPGSSSATAVAPAQLVALTETSLSLVGTLLVTMLSTPTPSAPTITVLTSAPSATLGTVNETQAQVNTAFLSVGPSQGQGPFTQAQTGVSGEGEAAETEPEAPAGQGQGQGQGSVPAAPVWVRSLLGTGEQFRQILQENHDAVFGADEPAAAGESPRNDVEAPAGDGSPAPASRRTQPPVPEQGRTDDKVPAADLIIEAVDVVIASFGAANRFWCAEQSHQTHAEKAPVAAWAPAVLAATLVVHASPLAQRLRERRRVEGRTGCAS